jgi:hypothetical protein
MAAVKRVFAAVAFVLAALHRSRNEGAANYSDQFIANLEDGDKDLGAWLKVSADVSGSFSVTNGRTAQTIRYAR